MSFFVFANLALVFIYGFFEWKDIAPTGLSGLGGIALVYLFDYLRKNKKPVEVVVVTVLTGVVALLLFYSYIPILTNGNLNLLRIGTVISVVFCAILAVVLYVTARERVPSVMGWMAFCATSVNSLPLIFHIFA